MIAFPVENPTNKILFRDFKFQFTWYGYSCHGNIIRTTLNGIIAGSILNDIAEKVHFNQLKTTVPG